MTSIVTKNLISQPYRKNSIINGTFDWWQRATSHSNIGHGSADRWAQWYSDGTTCTLSRQSFTPGQTEVPGNSAYYLRMSPSGGNPGTGYGNLYTAIENVKTHAGDTITVSFWARASVAGEYLQVGWTQKFGNGGSPTPRRDPSSRPFFPLTTSWDFYHVTFAIPRVEDTTLGTSGTDALFIDIAHTSMSEFPQPTGHFDIAQVQVETGPSPTEFEYRTAALELSLCQRYYETGFVHYIGYNPVANRWCGTYIGFNTKKQRTPTLSVGTPTENVNCGPTQNLHPQNNGFRINTYSPAGGNFYYTNTFAATCEI